MKYQFSQFSSERLVSWNGIYDLTGWEEHRRAEQSHLLLRHLNAAQTLRQLEDGAHQVVAALGAREEEKVSKAEHKSWSVSVKDRETHPELWTAARWQTSRRRTRCCWWGCRPDTSGSGGRPCSLSTHRNTDERWKFRHPSFKKNGLARNIFL